MFEVVVTDTDLGDDALEAAVLGPEFKVTRAGQARLPDEVVAAATGADGLFVQWARIDASVFRALPRLRAIVRFGVGLDNIDLEAAAAAGVAVSNVPDYCIDEVASHACAMIIADARRIAENNAAVQRGEWSERRVSTPLPAPEDPVGIAGFGRIGRALAGKLIALGHPVHVYDPMQPDTDLPVTLVPTLVSLAEAVNHLSLHMPVNPTTAGSCAADVLAALGPEGHLVNTSRGSLVDEEALLAALDTGTIRWASLDVVSTEPPREGTAFKLARHPRVTCTPHMAYLSTKSGMNLRRRAAERMAELLGGA